MSSEHSKLRILIPKKPLPDDWKLETPLFYCRSKKSSSDDAESEMLSPKSDQKKMTFKQAATSYLYISAVLFFVLNVYRVYFFLATMTPSTAEIIQSSKNVTAEEAEEEALVMTKRFGVVQFLGIFVASVNGLVIDAGTF